MAPAPNPLSRALARNAYPLAVASAVFMFAVGLPSTDSDTYWQLATGRWILDHGAFLRQDIFSSTVSGTRYGIGEWLGQVAFAGAFDIAGWAGIVILRALLVATAAFFVIRLARRGGAAWWVTLPLAVTALLVSKITWTDRPHLFTLALFPVLLELLLSLPAGASRRLFVFPPLLLVWSYLHGGYLIGLAVLAIFAAHAVLVSGRAGLPLAATTIVSAALTLLNPAPLELAGAAREDFLNPPRFLSEFLPPDVLTPAGFLFAALVLLVIGTAMLRGGSLLEALLLGPLLYLAFVAQRHMIFFSFAAPVFLAPRLASLLGGRRFELAPPIRVPTAVALFVVALVMIATAPTAPDQRVYPTGALATLRADSGVLLNEYDWGGYLIFTLPERPVFIDGRYVPYLGGVLDDYRAMVGLRPGWRALVDKYRVSELLLEPGRPLAVALREDGWRVRASDASGRWIVLARP